MVILVSLEQFLVCVVTKNIETQKYIFGLGLREGL